MKQPRRGWLNILKRKGKVALGKPWFSHGSKRGRGVLKNVF